MQNSKYEPNQIESKWQKIWREKKIYSPDLDKAKRPFYNLMMFPYPSAEGLHVGNMYAFTGSDVYGRFQRMRGYDVFEPMGLDGFGIHSENYALKVGKHPIEQAKTSEANFYRQLQSIGNGFDWERKLETYDPDYYKWTQWIFIQLFKQGLAYRKKAPVNFCPSCKTVLADEQVIEGKCERCSSLVEKRDLEQWFFRITEYADRLLSGLEKIDWSEKVKIAQKNWIGKSEGMEISFPVILNEVKDLGSKDQDSSPSTNAQDQNDMGIKVYTVFPETIYGVTFMVLAPEHPLVSELTTIDQESHVAQYIKEAKAKSDIQRTDAKKEKTGVFTGSYCINPVNNKKIPIYIADYVLATYGTGAVMGVPGSDHRDFEFAKKYDLSVIQVISNAPNRIVKVQKIDQVLEQGYLVNSGEFSGLETPGVAREKIKNFLEEKRFGKRHKQFHLRDWLISRQRYWGPPIPMIFCSSCASQGKSYFSTQSGELLKQPQNEAGNVSSIRYKVSGIEEKIHNTKYEIRNTHDMAGWFPVPDEDLPVMLPDVQDWKPQGTGTSPLAAHPEFYETTCPECGSKAKRETDVSDTFLDSAWYFFRYTSVEDKAQAWSPRRAQKWLPVNMYIGGAEHSVLHLLYSRFLTMVFKDMGLVDFEEPFTRFYAHGLIIKDGTKMSKSKGNVVIPDEYIRKFGADTLRTYLMFTGPYNMGGDFRDSGVEGMFRFLNRVWSLLQTTRLKDSSGIAPYFHKLIKESTEDMEALRYNTAIAKLMMYYNELSKQKEVTKAEALAFLRLLAPFAPHMAEELWDHIGEKGSVHTAGWPTFDPSLLQTDTATIAVQVNGKLRDTITVESSKAKVQSEVEELARSSSKLQSYIAEKTIKKIIYVPGKIINFVLE